MRAAGPEHTPVQERMAEFAAEHRFPNIGPEAGGVLRTLARLTGAGTVFEFGSGFGYSASWFLRGGADHVVLTELDDDELDQGREFLADAGLADRCSFEGGDALDTVDRYDGPFDVVLVDHHKEGYCDALEAATPKLREGGVVVADNVMRGPIDFDAVLAHLEGEPEAIDADDEPSRAIADYLDTVCHDDRFETVALPVGSGLAVSTKVA
ncbi:O-methyltransferase family protein [Candidatus Halobonum tyrrellensis G22]|uniref:O-methyltransferase family protein n=1 Tax=Candidatus Halobonum tyrrellensis G22 TaxID=1324957 RepID=V4HJH3_9EURY|nr:O-methyltransferase family protein [Candidatus Halobonum tyrrellensis G22]